jgi:hypothetical protein
MSETTYYLRFTFSDITSTKSQKEIMQEIQAIMRQITASVTFLPLLSEPCCFDLLVYADQAATVPITWEDSDPCYISNSEEVRLRSFNTQVRLEPSRVHGSFHYTSHPSLCRRLTDLKYEKPNRSIDSQSGPYGFIPNR